MVLKKVEYCLKLKITFFKINKIMKRNKTFGTVASKLVLENIYFLKIPVLLIKFKAFEIKKSLISYKILKYFLKKY